LLLSFLRAYSSFLHMHYWSFFCVGFFFFAHCCSFFTHVNVFFFICCCSLLCVHIATFLFAFLPCLVIYWRSLYYPPTIPSCRLGVIKSWEPNELFF
jgi:hypothetical protein